MKLIDLTEVSQLIEILERSSANQKSLLIFKHSTRCAISSMALNRFTRSWELDSEHLPVYLINVIKDRDVSNKVSELLGVRHESPQVLLVKNGEAIYSASHNAISPKSIAEEVLHVQ